MWKVIFTAQAQKDAKKLASSGLKNKAVVLIDIVTSNPFKTPPPYEKLRGDLTGFYSRRINIQRRLVYQVIKEKKIVKVLRLWTHYE